MLRACARPRRGGRAAGRQHRAGRRRRAARRRGRALARAPRPSSARSTRAPLQVSAGAGVTLAALQAHARAAGLDAGVDFAARDSATLGGLVATEARHVPLLPAHHLTAAGGRFG